MNEETVDSHDEKLEEISIKGRHDQLPHLLDRAKKLVAISDASGYSAAINTDQPQVMAAGGPSDDDQVVPHVAQVSKAKLKDEDLAMFLLLLQREQDAVNARNEHCMKVEKKYGLSGFTWTFDPKSGTIQRTGKRQPEKK